MSNFPALLEFLPRTASESADGGVGGDGDGDGEDDDDEADEARTKLAATPPEALLCRWANYHLSRHSSAVSLGSEIELSAMEMADCHVYLALLHELSAGKLFGSVEQELATCSALKLLAHLNAYGCTSLLLEAPEDLCSPTERFVHLSVLASVFAVSPFPRNELKLRTLLGAPPPQSGAQTLGARAAHAWLSSLPGVLDDTSSEQARAAAAAAAATERAQRAKLAEQFADGLLFVARHPRARARRFGACGGVGAQHGAKRCRAVRRRHASVR